MLLAMYLVSSSHPNPQVKPQLLHAPGDIKTAQLDFLGYTIPDQAFRELTTRCQLSILYLSHSGSYLIRVIGHSSRARHAGPRT